MAIHVALHHLTHYRFDRQVGLAPHIIRLRPAVHSRTPIKAYSLKIEPANHFLNWQQDAFGNWLGRVVFPEKARELKVEVSVVADMTVINPFEFFLDEDAEKIPFTYDAAEKRDLAPYLRLMQDGPLLRKWVDSVDRKATPTIDFLVALNQRLANEISYSIRMEPGVQAPDETLERGIGSCRDSGWLLVQILRHLGMAARFVSGYLVQLVPDVKSLDGPSGPEQDFTDLHAWAEVYLPGAGWVGLDPTSGLFAGEGHIPLACTPEPGTAAPIDGALDECEVEFHHANDVTRVREDPRVTKPYSDAEWQAIDALGRKVDADLNAMDVRLTMGGEPTFVSIDDMEGDEWNTDADGPDKRRLAEQLFRRMHKEFAPGGVLQHGQGKWYPGEPLPRWTRTCIWRSDGEPMWEDPDLLAGPEAALGHGREEAEALAGRIAKGLGFKRKLLIPAREDLVYHLWQEQRLPEGVDPAADLDGDLADEMDRKRLARVLDRGLGEPVGWVLPLGYDSVGCSFTSSRWPLRRDQLVLVPGDSPMGMRLPLDTLPWQQDPVDDVPDQPLDPFAAQPGDLVSTHGKDAQPVKLHGTVLRDKVVHTALCIEPRDGVLHLFLPPLPDADAWVQLLTVLEAAARDNDTPVVLEGYEAPRDPRLQRFAVTPDPGVIEVNVQPTASWPELTDQTMRLYELARQCRLGTEKFMQDGRHTGTGGGNHVTVGAASPVDSPFLRRPDLLGSLVTCWQMHPSLSYLFSGLFIGPTSQAPRVDEARDDRLAELDIALGQLPSGESQQPWLVDRVMRHLLTDLTGNTHRSEICIDKLYSPDSASGRLGLVEFRAFEMPPHARMSMVQMLLLRALIAMFWKQPLRRRPVRWGTQLHDRFLMPHHCWEDFKDLLAELDAAGYPLQAEWFASFREFRFPVYGTVQVGELELELRGAIEPWHVLGEEVTSSGTARFVDSSVERLQVRVTGAMGDRYQVACNGRRVPLRATGRKDEQVAGVRYRAWAPPSALHPTIGVHAPLTFDVIDTWTGRAVGGCTYHVVHAGGRSHDDFPVNAYAAESRRHARFWDFGHSPGALPTPPVTQRLATFLPGGSPVGPMAPPAEEAHGDQPFTLDMRRPAPGSGPVAGSAADQPW